jgi:hemerythrin-like domain-containing protein
LGIQIGAKPDSGFDDPLGMLSDCHRRIEHFLHILCFVAGRAQGRSLTYEEAAAVEAALGYFHLGGVRHTADEEESLFPRLIATGAFAELEQLEHDHRDAGGLHAEVETLYQKWIRNKTLTEPDTERLLAATNGLRELYETHIRMEDEVVFPRAAKLLDRSSIEAIGQEFRGRRQ